MESKIKKLPKAKKELFDDIDKKALIMGNKGFSLEDYNNLKKKHLK